MQLARWLAAAAPLMTSLALAHHSPAAYDMAAATTIEGTVSDFDWANPHAYLSVTESAGGAERTWLVELVTPAVLKNLGWTPTTLAAGDRVTLVVHPGRNPARNIGFLMSIAKGGTELFDTGQTRGTSPTAAASRPTFRATGLAGVWITEPGPAIGQLLENARALPVTPAGAAAMREFRDTVNPGRDCVPFSSPLYSVLPISRSIELDSDAVRIRGEDDDVERIVHLNRTTHDGAARSLQGDSIGRFENGALVVDTTLFQEHRLGNAAGLPSGPNKHLVERFELAPDGDSLIYSYELSDPDYLTATVRGTATWVYRPDLTYSPIACDLENARRFLGE